MFKLTIQSIASLMRSLVEGALEGIPRSERTADAVLYSFIYHLWNIGVYSRKPDSKEFKDFVENGYPEELIDFTAGLGWAIEDNFFVRILPKPDMLIFSEKVLSFQERAIKEFILKTGLLYNEWRSTGHPISIAVVGFYTAALNFPDGSQKGLPTVDEFDINDALGLHDGEEINYPDLYKFAIDYLLYFGYTIEGENIIQLKKIPKNAPVE